MTARAVVLGIAALVLGGTALEAQPFESRRIPIAPGERRASVVVSLGGFSRSRVQVWMHYSNNESDLNTSSVSKGRASCRTLDGARLRCEFLFPHLDHPTPNILTKTEIDGGEPPNDRPTVHDYNRALAQFTYTGQMPYVQTDSNPKRIGSPNRVYYRWVRIITGSGGSTVNDSIRSFQMARLLIVANLGDSYASGEGSPNRNLVRTLFSGNGALDDGKANDFANEPMWDDTPCHRSEESGQERGVRNVIRQRPDVAIRLANFACSGAVTSNLTHNSQPIDPNQFMDPANRRRQGTRKPQLDQLEEWLQEEQRTNVDLMLLSISGNDAGFGTVARKCLIDNIASECRNDSSVVNLINERLPLIRGRLDDIRADLQGRPFTVHRIVQFGYPDPTRDSNGAFCSPTVPVTQTCWGPLERGISQADFRFIHDSFLTPLNSEISAFAASTPNWVFVGTAALSRTRGLCNCSGFFNTVGQSDFIQGDLYGSMHPNRAGHQGIYQPITEEQLKSRITTLFSQSATQQTGN